MAKALFVVDFPPAVSLPAMDELHYEAAGRLRGGFSAVGEVPQGPTCLVLVEGSAARIADMEADARYLYVEGVADEPEG